MKKLKKIIRRIKRTRLKYLSKKKIAIFAIAVLLSIFGTILSCYQFITNDIETPSITLKTAVFLLAILSIVVLTMSLVFKIQLEDMSKDTSENIEVTDLAVSENLKNREILNDVKDSVDDLKSLLSLIDGR